MHENQKFNPPLPDETGLAVNLGEIPFTRVAVKDLPLYIIITNRVFDTGLPQKEFSGEEEFEDYLQSLAREKFESPGRREKFIKKHMDSAIFMEDEISGDHAWQFNGEVRFKNARACGLGILKTQSRQFFMFQTALGMDLPSQLAAYQALTYGKVNREYLPLFATEETRTRLRSFIGDEVYQEVLNTLGISGPAGDFKPDPVEMGENDGQ